MNHMRIALVFLSFFALNFQNSFSQKIEKTQSINEGSINEQFNYLLDKSNNYQDYKVVKKVLLNQLKINTIDSIQNLNNNLLSKEEIIKNQELTITNLNSNLDKVNNQFESVSKEKDQMSFFGLATTKTIYYSLIYSFIVFLLVVIFVFVYKFINSNKVTRKAKAQLADLEKEYEDHRRVALEREQKVRRQLQDEINKQKGV